jgi:hypothetical protein
MPHLDPRPQPVPPPRLSETAGRARAALLLSQRLAGLARAPEADLSLLEAEYLCRSADWGASLLADADPGRRLQPAA